MGTAWARHVMCESAFSPRQLRHFICFTWPELPKTLRKTEKGRALVHILFSHELLAWSCCNVVLNIEANSKSVHKMPPLEESTGNVRM